MKTQNYQKGQQGEELAVAFLTNANYRVLDRNYKRSTGEIDIVIQKEATIVFVEVKYRKNLKYGFPREAVNLSKQKRIGKTALWYLKEKKLFDVSVRFDVLEIYFEDDGKRVINHYENAFMLR